MKNLNEILAKSASNGNISLIQHLTDVSLLAEKVAANLRLNPLTAKRGAIFHDIGKTSSIFQKTLQPNFQRPPDFLFRHEIASLFFTSLLDESEKYDILEMVVGHHKSIYLDSGGKGILDLYENDPDFIAKHLIDFEHWSTNALAILKLFDFDVHEINNEEAILNLQEAINYCEQRSYGYSIWKGVLIAADHLASAMKESPSSYIDKLFILPDLNYYHSRKSALYPLSLIPTNDSRIHTIVTAPTGAGKTDFLIRRCTGRVFYTLPFQASINAMYERIISDLSDTKAQVRLQHASSSIKLSKDEFSEIILQRHIGASVKVMTPHQLASVVFGTKGYEALITDLYGCDIILDEIHTYSETTQAIVLKIVEILVSLKCNIHIGTATMPTVLYNELLKILGNSENVYEVSLNNNALDEFNRHIIHKIETFDSVNSLVEEALMNCKKVMIVCNQVKKAQTLYSRIDLQYPDVKKMLIHSRFKRSKRNELETKLKESFNNSDESCIVVSTQVVEVSLDISFDLMITECAPIDALIQRFGRINRKRTKETIGVYKHIFVIQPPENIKDCLPYKAEVLKRTYDILVDNELLKERALQELIDKVYPSIEMVNIDLNSVWNKDHWQIKELWHRPKSALLEVLDIDSVSCIVENDQQCYEESETSAQVFMEIPVSYNSIAYKNLNQSIKGSRPYIIPNKSYSDDLGFLIELAKSENYNN